MIAEGLRIQDARREDQKKLTTPAVTLSVDVYGACSVQIENEFGFVGKDSGADETYIRHLLNTAKNALGSDVIFFTTDPPDNAYYGTLRGGEVYTWAPNFH